MTQEKVANDTLHYYSYTIFFSKSCCKVKLWPSDAGVLPLGVFSLAGLPQMAALVWKKLQMTPCTIPNNTCLPKVAIKLSHGLPDVEVLPLGVVSLAELHPDGRRGPEKVTNDSLYYPKQYLFNQKWL